MSEKHLVVSDEIWRFVHKYKLDKGFSSADEALRDLIGFKETKQIEAKSNQIGAAERLEPA